MASKASEVNGQFFQLAPAWSWLLVIVVFAIYEVFVTIFVQLRLTTITVYQTSLLPCDPGEHYFCYMAKEYHSALQNGFWVLIFIHVLEAIYAGQICRKLNLETEAQIKWILQTFVLGVISLKILINKSKNTKHN